MKERDGTKKPYSLYLPADLIKQIRCAAAMAECGASELVAQACECYFAAHPHLLQTPRPRQTCSST